MKTIVPDFEASFVARYGELTGMTENSSRCAFILFDALHFGDNSFASSSSSSGETSFAPIDRSRVSSGVKP